MNQKTLGNTDITVTQIGLGCMGLSEFYGPPTEISDAIKLLHEAIELGVDHFDTAESYGIGSATPQPVCWKTGQVSTNSLPLNASKSPNCNITNSLWVGRRNM